MRILNWIPLLTIILAVVIISADVAEDDSSALIEDVDGVSGFSDNIEDDDDDDDEEDNAATKTATAATTATTTANTKVEAVPYVKPPTAGLEFSETFDGDVFARWIKSGAEKFIGNWSVLARQTEAIIGDVGLRVMDKSAHHGISTKLRNAMTKNLGKSIVVSYEAKFEETLECGGAYLKLFSTSDLTSKGADMSQFDNETPYFVMFGPDRCGSTNKVHVIIKQLNPISNKWVEHHLVDPPRVPYGTGTHLYSLHIKPDNSYEVLVDNVAEKSGSMTKDFDPPFTPLEDVDDPTDKKPDDWVDESRISDPNAKKPDDWDDEAPREVPDENATMPDGWLVDSLKSIPDPTATKPESWNDEEDGEWTAPLIPNPECINVPGCGEWKPPMIRNPKYKGTWFAPLVDNPAYKGPWKARRVPNPDYFVSQNPHALPDFDAVGFELWTVQNGMLFDNIVISRSIDAVKTFIEKTWVVRHGIEAQQQPLPEASAPGSKTEGVVTAVMLFASERPIVFGVASASAILLLIMVIIKLCKSSSTPIAVEKDQSVVSAPKKGTTTKTSDTSSGDSNEEEESEEKEGELLKEKKVVDQTRQRRAKRD